MKQLLLLPFLLLLSSCFVSEELPADQTFWRYNLPAAYSFNEQSLLRLDSIIGEEDYGSVNSLMIIKDNELIFENYYDGSFRSRQRPIDMATFGYAVAFLDFFIEDGLIGNLDEPIYSFLPEYDAIFEASPDKRLITFRHLILQESGLSWNQMVPSTNPEGDISQMRQTTDWVSYILSKELSAPPGTRTAINTASGIIFFKIFQNLLGDLDLETYLHERYFEPLAISDYSWTRDPIGTLDGASGLSLYSFDHAKFGTLIVNGGRTPDRLRIFSEAWVFEMTRAQATFSGDFDLCYGFRAFRSSTISVRDLTGYVVLPGEIGQSLYIYPEGGLVIAVGAENHFQHMIFNSSFYIFFSILSSMP